MTTSGITINQLSRDSIINSALRKCQVLQEGQSANTDQLSTGAEALNSLVKELYSIGMPLWKRTSLTITLITGQNSYIIGVGQSINNPYPIHVQQCLLLLPSSNSQILMNIVPHYDFKILPRNAVGIPVSVNYQPQINQGTLSVWPTPNASVPSGTILQLTYTQPFEVFSAGTDTADFPQEWTNALIYGLAASLADEYALPIQDKQWIDRQAEKHISTALSNGGEDGSWFFQIDKKR